MMKKMVATSSSSSSSTTTLFPLFPPRSSGICSSSSTSNSSSSTTTTNKRPVAASGTTTTTTTTSNNRIVNSINDSTTTTNCGGGGGGGVCAHDDYDYGIIIVNNNNNNNGRSNSTTTTTGTTTNTTTIITSRRLHDPTETTSTTPRGGSGGSGGSGSSCIRIVRYFTLFFVVSTYISILIVIQLGNQNISDYYNNHSCCFTTETTSSSSIVGIGYHFENDELEQQQQQLRSRQPKEKEEEEMEEEEEEMEEGSQEQREEEEEEEEEGQEQEHHDDDTMQKQKQEEQQQQHQQEQEQLYFVVHIGPPKTATTTLQIDITDVRQVLLEGDNYVYCGSMRIPYPSHMIDGSKRIDGKQSSLHTSMYDHMHNLSCQTEIYQSRIRAEEKKKKQQQQQQQQQATSSANKQSDGSLYSTTYDHYNNRTIPACEQKFINELTTNPRYKNKSIIVSEEALSFQTKSMSYNYYKNNNNDGTNTTTLTKGGGKWPIDWISLQETISKYGGYQLIIVTAYRRLYERIPSVKQEKDKYGPRKTTVSKWPANDYNKQHVGQFGRELQPIFPNILQQPRLPCISGYPENLRSIIPDYIPIKVLNLYNEQGYSVRSSFLCDVLPNAYHACNVSRYRDLYIDDEETHANTEQSLYYDALGTALAKYGHVNMKQYKRHDVAIKLQEYHQQQLVQRKQREQQQSSWEMTTNMTNNKNDTTSIIFHDGFPIICPSIDDVQPILDESLRIEERNMPLIYKTRHDEHIQSFWNYVINKHKYCWIDINRTLELDEWKTFINQKPFY